MERKRKMPIARSVQFAEEDINKIRKAAKKLGLSVSGFLRMAALSEIRRRNLNDLGQ